MIEVIRNQPIQTRFKCSDCEEYERMQLVCPADMQRIQVRCHPAGPTVNLDAAGWSTTGTAIPNGMGGFAVFGAATMSHPVSLVNYRRYKIEMEVQLAGLGDTGGYRVKLNGVWVKLPDATDGEYSIVGGYVVAYIKLIAVNTPTLLIETTGDITVGLSNIKVSELSVAGLQVLNANKEVILDSGTANCFETPDSNVTTIGINWVDVADAGIYYLNIYDTLYYNTQLLYNGDFATNLDGWSNGVTDDLYWAWFGSVPPKAANSGAIDTEVNALTQVVALPGGSKYTLTFGLGGLDPFGTEGVQVYFEAGGIVLDLQTFSTPGSHTATLDLSAYTGIVQVRVCFKPLVVTDTIQISGPELKRVMDVGNITNPFTLAPRHHGTMVFYGKCINTAFGYEFARADGLGAAFYFSVRIRARVNYVDYPDVTEVYEFSNDVEQILTTDPKKNFRVYVRGNPEYLHDALRLMRLCDEFTINGIAYVRAGDYQLLQTEGMCPAAATFDMRAQQGLPDSSFNTNEPYWAVGYATDGYV